MATSESSSNSTKLNYVWFDCDPGHDDMFALILAANSANIKLVGVSTIAGNQTIQKTTKNALNVLNILGLVREGSSNDDSSIPQEAAKGDKFEHFFRRSGLGVTLLQGCSKPLLRPGVNCEEIHGESGLETYSTRNVFPPLPQAALEYIDSLNDNYPVHFTSRMYHFFKEQVPNKITLIATGPLTNVALLLINYPDVVKYIEKVIIMGGAMGIGNTGPVAEFNIQVDPDAASILFNSGLPIYMVPLEITHLALVNDSIISSIRSIGTSFSESMIDLLNFFKHTYKRVFYMDEPPLHDPCAVACAVDPSIFEFTLMRVDVETSSHLSYGQTVCDIYNMSPKKKNVHVCMKMNVDKFWALMIEALRKTDANFSKLFPNTQN